MESVGQFINDHFFAALCAVYAINITLIMAFDGAINWYRSRRKSKGR